MVRSDMVVIVIAVILWFYAVMDFTWINFSCVIIITIFICLKCLYFIWMELVGVIGELPLGLVLLQLLGIFCNT